MFCRLYTPTLHFHGSERNFCPFYWISLSRKRFHSLSSPALRTRKMELSSCGWPKICRTRPDRSSISLDSSFVLFLKGFWVLLGFNCSHPSFLLLIHMCSSTQSLFTCTGLLRHSLLITSIIHLVLFKYTSLYFFTFIFIFAKLTFFLLH